MKINSILAAIILGAAFLLFAVIIYDRLGGDQALFLIIGHIAAWAELVVIFYFRKKPSESDTDKK